MMTNKNLAQTLRIAAKMENIALKSLLNMAADHIDPPDDQAKPDEKDAALQVVWEQLNGAMSDLNELGQKVSDVVETVEDCIARLEAIGVHAEEK
jgi:tellurite resistance protein